LRSGPDVAVRVPLPHSHLLILSPAADLRRGLACLERAATVAALAVNQGLAFAAVRDR